MRLLVKYRFMILALASLIATGIFGYMGIEGWSFLDALYMTIITFTTVGYGEVRPLSDAGRIFTTFLMIGGVGAMLYALTLVVQRVVEEEFLRSFLRRRRMESRLSRMSDHFIVCGFGRVGRSVAEAFLRESEQVAVIDANDDALMIAREMGIPYVNGPATDDASLTAARIDKARGLIAALGDDPENVFVTLTARGLNPNLHIVARASRSESVRNLERAGADRVILPHEIGGLRMAMSAIRPLATDFLDSVLMPSDDDQQRLTEVLVTGDSPLASGPISRTCHPAGVHVLAIRRGEDIIVNPDGGEVCRSGDTVILVGSGRTLATFERGG